MKHRTPLVIDGFGIGTMSEQQFGDRKAVVMHKPCLTISVAAPIDFGAAREQKLQ